MPSRHEEGMGITMEIYPPRYKDESLEELKNCCSEYKRVPKIHSEKIAFLEQFQKTVNMREAILLNNLRRMPEILFLEQMQIFHNINRLYNHKNDFYRRLSDFLETKF